jgi:hypothetical protein
MVRLEQLRPQAFGFTLTTAAPFTAPGNVINQQTKEDNRKPRGDTQQQRLATEGEPARQICVVLHVSAIYSLSESANGYKHAIVTRGKDGLQPRRLLRPIGQCQ